MVSWCRLITRVVNYLIMRCRVRAPGSPVLAFRTTPRKEREKTNKSASALRRDIVSRMVNHLRGLNALPLLGSFTTCGTEAPDVCCLIRGHIMRALFYARH